MTTDLPCPSPTAEGNVLVYAFQQSTRAQLAQTIASFGFSVETAADFTVLLDELNNRRFDLCVIDDDGHLDGETASRIRALNHEAKCLLLVEAQQLADRATIPAIAGEIVETPCSPARLKAAVESGVARSKLLAENRRLRAQLSQQLNSGLIGMGSAMVALRDRVAELAAGDQPLLIRGEAGTELAAVARAVHAASRRAHRPFAKIDCSLLTSENLERELFGKETQPDGASTGRLDWAEGGTLLLENIDRASQRLHGALLAAIESAVRAKGPGRKGELDALRVMVAIYDNTDRLPETNHFCDKLFALLSATVVTVPPLRERREDIGLLAESLLDQLAASTGRPSKRLSLNSLNLLREHGWPENVAELRRVLQQASVCGNEPRITAEAIRPWLAAETENQGDETPWLSLREMERRLIETTFARCGGNREQTAQALKIGLRTLSGKLREYGYPPRGGPGSNRRESDRAA